MRKDRGFVNSLLGKCTAWNHSVFCLLSSIFLLNAYSAFGLFGFRLLASSIGFYLLATSFKL